VSTDYNTYVGPYLYVTGPWRAFAHETHVDVFRWVTEHETELPEGAAIAIPNMRGVGAYADRDCLCVIEITPDRVAVERLDFCTLHGDAMLELASVALPVLRWGVVSWAS